MVVGMQRTTLLLGCLLVLAFLPSVSWAECLSWVLCPYRIDADRPNARYVSLNDTSLRQWSEIEIDRNRAIVCMEEDIRPNQLSASGCTEIIRAEIPVLLVPPKKPFFNGVEIKFRNDQTQPFDPDAIMRRVNDSAITRDVLEGRR